ncbi:MAG: type II toxin-antitoxin system VapB family antitoxin [Chloroflexi bacterium]|nr:type II toxin-antitoxin system VapB family antitoxin [Chloroflexota bacterium]
MRTTVDIPDDLLRKVMYWSKARTKKESLTIALKEYVRREAGEALIAMAGTMPDFPNVHEELERIEMEEHGVPGARKFLEGANNLPNEGRPAKRTKVAK